MKRDLVDERIRELYEKHGKITPDIVIEDAKSPESPLHEHFEWDLNKAALEAWRDTARTLIRSVKVVVTTETVVFNASGYKPPEFVRDPSAKTSEQGYSRVFEVKTDKERSREALMYELERITGCLVRAKSLCLALGLDDEIEIAENVFKQLKKKAKDSA